MDVCPDCSSSAPQTKPVPGFCYSWQPLPLHYFLTGSSAVWTKCHSHSVHDRPLYLPFTVSDTSFSPAPSLGTTARHTYFPASSGFTAFSVRVFLLLSTCVVRKTVSEVGGDTCHFYLIKHQFHWHKRMEAFNKLLDTDKNLEAMLHSFQDERDSLRNDVKLNFIFHIIKSRQKCVMPVNSAT